MPLGEIDARRLLRRLLEEGVFVVSPHARHEMAKDGLTDLDIVNVLRGGRVQPAEWENGSWRYRAQTQRMAVVFAFEPEPGVLPDEASDLGEWELVVVTAWKQKQ
jgi:hypothetical protein